jgi:hypothetical protein
MNDTEPRINWDCEFFTGENERLLLAATLNTIELEDLPKFVKMLNEFLRLRPSQDDFVKDIVLDGCDDAVVRLTSGGTIEICGETTTQEILGLI